MKKFLKLPIFILLAFVLGLPALLSATGPPIGGGHGTGTLHITVTYIPLTIVKNGNISDNLGPYNPPSLSQVNDPDRGRQDGEISYYAYDVNIHANDMFFKVIGSPGVPFYYTLDAFVQTSGLPGVILTQPVLYGQYPNGNYQKIPNSGYGSNVSEANLKSDGTFWMRINLDEVWISYQCPQGTRVFTTTLTCNY